MASRVLELQFDFKGDERGKLIPLEALSGHRLDWPTRGLLIEGCVWRGPVRWSGKVLA